MVFPPLRYGNAFLMRGGGGGGGCLAIASQFGIFSAPAGRSENFFRIIQFTIFLI